MSQSLALQLHITQMEEIRSILNSMKNLALIEIHKLSRFQTMQGQAVATIEQVAQDFLAFYPGLPRVEGQPTSIAILMGAERGFCGDFNESLLDIISNQTYSGIIAIGSRLQNRLEGSPIHVVEALAGANVAEEVPLVLNNLIETLNNQQQMHSTLVLTVIYHDTLQNSIVLRQIFPPFVQAKQSVTKGNAPILNLPPPVFFADLIHHYLFAVLHEIFYLSLMAENHRRLQHLEAAVKHLDDDVVAMRRKSQVFRQEEITEEIEVILLNTENFIL